MIYGEMVLRRAAKKAARLKRKEFYLCRCRFRAMAFRRFGITQTYYNGEWRKFMVLLSADDKWNANIDEIRRYGRG